MLQVKQLGRGQFGSVWLAKRPGVDALCTHHLVKQHKATIAALQVKELGRGQFGSVWLAKWLGVDVAVKELHSMSDAKSNAEMIRVRPAVLH